MNHYPASIVSLIRNFSQLPGIGEKTAERLALHVLKAPRKAAEALSQSLMEVKDKIRLCGMCFSLSDTERCSVCNDATRDATLLCVVERPADMVSIEKSGGFRGLYHVLGGCLSPMDGIGPEEIRIEELIKRISAGDVREVVLATGTNLEGDSTAAFIAQRLKSYSVKVSRIASGVPVGGDLKYIDQLTLKRAMETRHDL
jgi:recombination protein RecR